MENNIVITCIAAACQMEIANRVKPVGDNSLLLTLPKQNQVLITVKPLRNDPFYRPPEKPQKHTYHYNANPDAGGKLQLLSLEDCRSYLNDVCQNLLDAEYRDGELTFPNGDIYLLTTMTYN